MERNLTTGSPIKLLAAFALPVFLGNIFQIVYNLVDMAIVGRFVSVDALAAVGAVGSIMFCINGIVTGFCTGFGILIARYFGAGDEPEMKRYTAMSIGLCVLIGVVITIAGCACLNPLFHLMKMPSDIYTDAYNYLFIILIGSIASLGYNMLACLLRAIGDSRTPLAFLVFSSALNILLDLAAVLLLHMGVIGVALATVTAQLVSAILCWVYIRRRYQVLSIEKQYRRVSGVVIKNLMIMGVPMALQFSVCSIGIMIVQTAMNEMGAVIVAGYAVAGKLAGFAEQPFVSVGTAVANYVGQNYGAGEYKRIHQGVGAAIILSMVLVIAEFILSMTVIGPATAIFVGSEATEVIAVSVEYFRLIAWFYVPLSLVFVYRNALQGIGDALVPMLGSVAEVVARFGVIAVVGTTYGFIGAALANPIAWIAALLPLIPVFYYRMRKCVKFFQANSRVSTL
ncbi:MAG: MATE family efflux transporter [Lachnospiraceae bacterium]|nr:MATE family efflux transporter [Candidatus Equihabitans merdae]